MSIEGEDKIGADFLREKYKLQSSLEAEAAAKRTERIIGKKLPEDPATRIQNYLDRFKNIIEPPDQEKHLERKQRNLKMLKNALHQRFVIKAQEIPQTYFQNILQRHAEEGRPIEEIPEDIKAELAQTLIADQEKSLDLWVDYLASNDAKYPDWLKYWAFRNILVMGHYDKEKKKFTERSKSGKSVSPFPDLNREALAFVFDAMEKKRSHLTKTISFPYDIHEEEEDAFLQYLERGNFSRLYAWAIEKINPITEKLMQRTEGEWRKYPQGSDHLQLAASLANYGTGWCIRGEATAKRYLEESDLEIFYSVDEKGEPKVPRVVIVTDFDGKISEVRGVADQENLDPYIGEVVQNKLQELPDGKSFEKKSQDMRTLTAIDRKVKSGQELSLSDLRFLYELDAKIEGFGYDEDPRILEIQSQREIRADLSQATGFSEDQISATEEEALSGKIKFHYGDLDLQKLRSAEGLKLPESISSYLDLSGLKSAKGLELPRVVGGLDLSGLNSAKGLELPPSINGTLDLSGLISAEDLELPQFIGGDLCLYGLISAKGLKLPESIGGDLCLFGLTSAEDLELPESIGGDLNLSGLDSVKGLKLPESIGGDLNLNGLTSAEGLKLPRSIRGDLELRGLTSAKGLELLPSISGNLDLSGLTSPDGLKLPQFIGGSLFLWRLTSAEGLKFPQSISGYLHLKGLTSAKGLKLPESISGYLDLSGLTSAEGLELPESIDGNLDLSGLTSAEGLELPQSIGGYLYLRNLTSAEGLELPQSIGGYLYLDSLTSTERAQLRKKYPNFNIHEPK